METHHAHTIAINRQFGLSDIPSKQIEKLFCIRTGGEACGYGSNIDEIRVVIREKNIKQFAALKGGQSLQSIS